MCDEPVPCACTLERRIKLREQHIKLRDDLSSLAYRLHKDGHIDDNEMWLLYSRAEDAWDDAIHIASSDDPLRSLCGQFGRNLTDLPDRPDGGSGCWTCLMKADELQPKERELVHA